MLVLSRKVKEDLIIAGNIIVRVVGIRGDKVRLGIEAPTDITVHRREVQNAINRKARNGQADAAREPDPQPAAPVECGRHTEAGGTKRHTGLTAIVNERIANGKHRSTEQGGG